MIVSEDDHGTVPGEPVELSLARLFDLALDMLCVAGTDGYFKRVNPAFEHNLGYSNEELLSRPFTDFVHPQDVDATLAAIRSLSEGRPVADFENRYLARDGTWRWLVWRSMPSDDGRYIYGSARDITVEKRALAEAGEYGSLAERQGRDLERLTTVHQVMTRAVAEGATTPDLLRSVAELTGKPTALFSAALRLLDSAEPPGWGRRAPRWSLGGAGHQVRRLLKGLDATHPSTVLPASPEQGINARHLLGRVAARGEHFGYLVVAEVGTQLSWFDTQVVEHSSTVLSLELLSRRREEDAARQAREDFVADLLQGDREAGPLRRRSTAYGVDLDRPHLLVRVAWDPAADHSITGVARRGHVARHLAKELGQSQVIAVGVPGADVFMCPQPPGTAREAAGAIRAATRRALDAAGMRRRTRGAVISGPCSDVDHYPMAHRELRVVLEALNHTGVDGQVVLVSDLGVLRLLISNGTVHSARRFAEELLGPLLDRRGAGSGGADLLATLRAFVACNAQYRETSRRLGVHENTVRYRLRQVRELTRIDPDELSSLLDARFALQALDMTRPAPDAAGASTEGSDDPNGGAGQPGRVVDAHKGASSDP